MGECEVLVYLSVYVFVHALFNYDFYYMFWTDLISSLVNPIHKIVNVAALGMVLG